MPDVEEIAEGDAVEVARENARRKAEAVEGDLVIGVDTVVSLADRLFGKPRDADDARAMLTALCGETHRVVSGLAVKTSGETEVVAAETHVTFRAAESLIDWYLPHGEWRERAGGYAIQGRGAAFVRRITGDYLNVVGLPVAAMLDRWPGVLDLAR